MRRLVAFVVTSFALAGCQQTLHLYASPPDGGGSAGARAGSAGAAGGGGQTGGRSGAGGSGPTDGGQPDGRCSGQSAPLTFTADTPQMVIALDRSSNMNQTFPMSTTTHLGAAMHALYSDISAYTANTGRPSLSFSFLDFPNTGKYCSGQPDCCAKDPTPIQSVTGLDGATICDEPGSTCISSFNRPVTAALTNAEQALANTVGPRYVMLLTDGDPDTDCSRDDCMDALKQVVPDLKAKGIRLFIVAIAAGNQSSCLFDLAMAVDGSTAPPYLMQAGSPNDVSADIQTGMLAGICSGTVAPVPSPSSVLDVRVGSSSATYSSTDGWTYDPSSSRIRFHGTACTAYAAGNTVQVTSTCTSGHTGSGGPP